MIKVTTTKTITCKDCGSEAVVKFGKYKSNQLYYCKVCKRKFKADDTIFHMKVSGEYVSSALNMYYSGMSFNDIRNHLKQEYDYYPSKSVIYGWVNKYTDLATKQFKDSHPQVGNNWVADETMLDVDGQHKVWFYDIIDEDTRYLLASRVAISRTTHEAEMLMKEASERAGKNPKTVVTDQNFSYLDGIEKAYGLETKHIQSKPFTKDSTSNFIERFHGTLKDRTKVIRSFKDMETLKQFTDGWLIYYNYFKPHTSLNGNTPAEQAGIKYKIKDWADLSRIPVPKHIHLESHLTPKVKVPKVHVKLDNAFKRHQKHKPERQIATGIFVSKTGMLSSHSFKGSKRIKGRII
jgi:putative transposase